MDRRGKHRPHNKTLDTEKDAVWQHIESFRQLNHTTLAKIQTRNTWSAIFLLGKCMICIELVAWKSTKMVTEKVYRQVFCNEYNISFHRQKKDQCVTCNQYKQKEESGNIDESTKHAYQEHQRRQLQGCQENWSPWYSWNIADTGAKHQYQNQSFVKIQ